MMDSLRVEKMKEILLEQVSFGKVSSLKPKRECLDKIIRVSKDTFLTFKILIKFAISRKNYLTLLDCKIERSLFFFKLWEKLNSTSLSLSNEELLESDVE